MTVTAGDILRVDVEGDFDGSELVMNSWQLQRLSPGSVSDAATLDDMRDLFNALYNAIDYIFTALTVWRRIRAYNMTTGLAMGENPFTSPIPGAGAGGSAPPGVSVLALFGLDLSNGQVRKFFGPCPAAAFSSSGNVQSTYAAPLLNDLTLTLTSISMTNGDYEVGHLGGTPAVWSTWDSIEVSSNPAYQRRRRRGRGA